MERDKIVRFIFENRVYFNSHAHVERDGVTGSVDLDTANFNSHAHVERDPGNRETERFHNEISTHTLTWSVTTYNGDHLPGNDDFNSHAHVERDCTYAELLGSLNISTHTLTWSVTS